MALTSSLSEEPLADTATLTSALVMGTWNGFADDVADQRLDGLHLHYCEDQSSAPVVAVEHQVQWVIFGLGVGDQKMARAVSSVRAVHPSVRLAVLGDSEDWRRCEAWLRRGCQVYLDADTAFPRMAAALVHAQAFDLTIVGAVFQRSQALRRAAGVPELTPRELDVLERLRQGLMNREIAGILHITENTVEYHIKKLASENRGAQPTGGHREGVVTRHLTNT
ncbi:helix-turn-helix transcriptional regulator [Corynebacterium cystitidis]|uniref:helix-turn-helix transcriptional regulator n=3 Tax=Corynebacterium cystitidis TaxID=35757 RepID=UPI00211E49D4|nr:LuxR C-terminal-related transcriptional regulator [Corynebacterium cystitidis]